MLDHLLCFKLKRKIEGSCLQEKPLLNVLIPTTSIPSANKGGLLTPKSPGPRLGAASRAGRKARRASNLAQLAEQAGASFFEGMN